LLGRDRQQIIRAQPRNIVSFPRPDIVRADTLFFQNICQEVAAGKSVAHSIMSTFNFGDGYGPVPAKRHINPDGTEGGWVANTATVAATAYVGPDAQVYGNARVFDNARVFGKARVSGNAWVYGLVSGNARVSGNAWVYGLVDYKARVDGFARVYGGALVCGDAYVTGDAVVTGIISHGTHK
jgi:hypothetical protein